MGVRSVIDCDKCGKEVPSSFPVYLVEKQKASATVIVEKCVIEPKDIPRTSKIACQVECMAALVSEILDGGLHRGEDQEKK